LDPCPDDHVVACIWRAVLPHWQKLFIHLSYSYGTASGWLVSVGERLKIERSFHRGIVLTTHLSAFRTWFFTCHTGTKAPSSPSVSPCSTWPIGLLKWSVRCWRTGFCAFTVCTGKRVGDGESDVVKDHFVAEKLTHGALRLFLIVSYTAFGDYLMRD
jgi:hypothetical protein